MVDTTSKADNMLKMFLNLSVLTLFGLSLDSNEARSIRKRRPTKLTL